MASLITLVLKAAESRKKRQKKPCKEINHVKQIVEPLFGGKKKRQRQRVALCLTATTENWEKVIEAISSFLKLPGIKHSLVPCSRTLRRVKTDYHCFFMSLMKFEKIYSGFRINLVAAVKCAAFMLWRKTDLNGMSVDIWGDGVEIGALDMIRLAYRFLGQKMSCQSEKSVFAFAILRGHDSRFVLENNMGWSIVR